MKKSLSLTVSIIGTFFLFFGESFARLIDTGGEYKAIVDPDPQPTLFSAIISLMNIVAIIVVYVSIVFFIIGLFKWIMNRKKNEKKAKTGTRFMFWSPIVILICLAFSFFTSFLWVY